MTVANISMIVVLGSHAAVAAAAVAKTSLTMKPFTVSPLYISVQRHRCHHCYRKSASRVRRGHWDHFVPSAHHKDLFSTSSSDEYCEDESRTRSHTTVASVPLPSFLNDSPSKSNDSFYDTKSFETTSLRAGEDGYSLLRRPISSSTSSFGSDDPVFDAPRMLDSIEERRRNEDVNRIWFEEQRQLRTTTTSSAPSIVVEATGEGTVSTSSAMEGNSVDTMKVDLHKRTADTLDYHSVLRALSDECTSAFGKRLVMSSLQSPKTTTAMSASSSTHDEDEDVLTMPLSAISARGIHRRYAAVLEMKRLMDMENGVIRHDFVVTPGSGYRKSNQQEREGSIAKGSYLNDVNIEGKKAKKITQTMLGLPPISGRILDLHPIFSIIDDGEVLEGPEILDVTTTLELSLDVLDWAEALREVNDYELKTHIQVENGDDYTSSISMSSIFIELPKLVQSIHVDDELLRILSNAFEKGTGRLDGTTFPSLGRLRAAIRSMKRDIIETVDSILAKPSMRDKLAVESGGALTMEINGRLVIPIQRKYHASVGGIVHDASRSGKTCYVEPTEITGPTNELRRAEAELRSEESRIWRELTELIIKHRPSIERNVACLGQLDVVLARVKLGKRLDGVIPTVGTDGVVNVRDAKHPVLLLRGLGKDAVVGSDIDIGQGTNQGLILTGPNSGGKTIILKMLGLYAFMVRDGIPIPGKPSEPARVDFFSPILADIGDMQSVDGDLSTFSGHMLVCREVLKNAGKDALVLMDELGSGTDPNQGVAIARALLEALLDRGCRVAITTHYLELKQLASTDGRFNVAGMQFVGGRPTYKLLPGVIGESFALAVAERLQLPDAVIRRAYELLDAETRQMGELIRDLEEQKLIVDQKNEELQLREREMQEMMEEMKKQQQKLEMTQLTARREEARKFAAKLEEKERLLDDILGKLKGSGATKKVVADSWSDIRIVKREVLSEAENLPGMIREDSQQFSNRVDDFELVSISEMNGNVNVDDKVIVCKKGAFFRKEGVVKEVGKKIQVIVGGVPVRLSTMEIAFPPSSDKVNHKQNQDISAVGRVSGGRTMSKMAQRSLELDSTTKSPIEMTSSSSSSSSSSDRGATFKMKSNTVDCIGLNFEESKRMCIDAFSKATMQNRSVVYILHGHGTGVLKKKIRSWLQSDRQWVKMFRPADQADGGDALTLVELKKQKLF